MKNNYKKYIYILVIVFLAACSNEASDSLQKRLSDTTSADEMWQVAEAIKSKGKDGIPIFLSVLSSMKENDKYVVIEYGRINVCLTSLYDLAKKGIYINEEVPILIDAFDKQLSITDTLVTANILRIITGIDTGYSSEFIKLYSGNKKDEEARQAKISEWQNWYNNLH